MQSFVGFLAQEIGWPISWLTKDHIKAYVAKGWWVLVAEIVQRGVRDTFFLAIADPVSSKVAEVVEESVRSAVGALRSEAEKLSSISWRAWSFSNEWCLSWLGCQA